MKLSKYQVIEVTDLRTRKKSYKVIVRNSLLPPVVRDIATREAAEAILREIEAGAQ